MSGLSATEALRSRFEAIREAELQRLSKKLRGLAPGDRSVVEAVAAEVLRTISGLPGRALAAKNASQRDVDALARLFGLES